MMEESSNIREIDDLRSLTAYPSFEDNTFKDRLKELESLGITSILSYGNTKIRNFSILGKGCVGLAVLVKYRKKICALKIRRTDANRLHMYNEVMMHSLANAADIGPILIDFSENFILMEFINGRNIVAWSAGDGILNEDIYNVLVSTLEQCYALDRIKLDHGQLSHLKCHLIISPQKKPTIIDFESASVGRKPSNVTAAANTFLTARSLYPRLNYIMRKNQTEEIIRSLSEYKKTMTRESFDKIIKLFYSALFS
jgi:putative serine/threonine protein kinase